MSTAHNLNIILENFDLYSILDLKPGESDLNMIKKAYYKKSLVYHPDKNPDNRDKFYIINLAYKILFNPDNKKKYDLEYFDKRDKKRNKITEKETDLMDLKYNDYPIIVSDRVINKFKEDFTNFSLNMVETGKTDMVKKFMDSKNIKGNVKEWESILQNNVSQDNDFRRSYERKQKEIQEKDKRLESEYEAETVEQRMSRYRNSENDIRNILSTQQRISNNFNLSEFNAMFEGLKDKLKTEDDGTMFLDSNRNTGQELIAYNAFQMGGPSNFYSIKEDTYVEPEVESNVMRRDINHNEIMRGIDKKTLTGRGIVNVKNPIKNTADALNRYNSERNTNIQVNRDSGAENKIKYGFTNPY
jgi:curved DNA-binding protein CbpA